MIRHNQNSELIELERMKGRSPRPDEARRKLTHAGGAPRSFAKRRPQSILRVTRVEEFIALFVLGMLGGIAMVFIAFLGR